MCRRADDAQTPAALPRVRFPSPPHSKICPRLSRPRSPTWPLSLSPRPEQTAAPLAPRRRMQEGKFGRPHARSSFQAGATPRRVRQDWTTDASRRKGKFTPRCGGRHGRHRCGPSTEGQHARRGKAGKGTRAERGGGTSNAREPGAEVAGTLLLAALLAAAVALGVAAAGRAVRTLGALLLARAGGADLLLVRGRDDLRAERGVGRCGCERLWWGGRKGRGSESECAPPRGGGGTRGGSRCPRG